MSKGHKSKGLRFDLIPPSLAEVAYTYTMGTRKYDEDHNWRRGLQFSDCLAALERHVQKFKMGQDRDEDGQHHLAAVCFHALAIMQFQYDGRADLDDRMFADIGRLLSLYDKAVILDLPTEKDNG